MDPKQLTALVTLADAADGPWLYSAKRRCVDTAQAAPDGVTYDGHSWAPVDNDDWAEADRRGPLIVAAVNDGPRCAAVLLDLLPAIERLRNAREALRRERFNTHHHGQTSTGQVLAVFESDYYRAVANLLSITDPLAITLKDGVELKLDLSLGEQP